MVFTATPDPGYRIADWSRNDIYLPVTGNVYSEVINAPVGIKVSFELDVPKYTVNFGVDGGNGSLTAKWPNFHPITTGDEIPEGETVYFTAVSDEGYMTDSWTISGGSFEAGTGTPENSIANAKVNAPITVRVSFKPVGSIPYSQLNIQGTVLKRYKGVPPPSQAS